MLRRNMEFEGNTTAEETKAVTKFAKEIKFNSQEMPLNQSEPSAKK